MHKTRLWASAPLPEGNNAKLQNCQHWCPGAWIGAKAQWDPANCRLVALLLDFNARLPITPVGRFFEADQRDRSAGGQTFQIRKDLALAEWFQQTVTCEIKNVFHCQSINHDYHISNAQRGAV